MKKITPVPNGPLIKKKGEFKGSTLKAGGKVKKAAYGSTVTTQTTTPPTVSMTKRDSIKAANKARIDSTLNARAKKFGFNTQEEYFNWQKQRSKGSDQPAGDACKKGSDKPSKCAVNLKAGGMIKRADGSYSKRGLWDNIRANKGSGKKPTKQMLVQEKKIKANTKK